MYIVTGLQKNKFYSKPNQDATMFLWHGNGCHHLSNNSTQPDRHRTKETNYLADEKYELTKQRDHLRMIRELMITDKDMRGKPR